MGHKCIQSPHTRMTSQALTFMQDASKLRCPNHKAHLPSLWSPISLCTWGKNSREKPVFKDATKHVILYRRGLRDPPAVLRITLSVPNRGRLGRAAPPTCSSHIWTLFSITKLCIQPVKSSLHKGLVWLNISHLSPLHCHRRTAVGFNKKSSRPAQGWKTQVQ